MPLDNHSEAGLRRATVEVRLAGAIGPTTDAAPRAAAAGAVGVSPEPEPSTVVVSVDSLRTTVHLRYWYAPPTGPVTSSAVVVAISEMLRRSRSEAWTVVAPPADQRFVPPPAV